MKQSTYDAFFIIKNMSILVKRSTFTLALFGVAPHVNFGLVGKQARSCSFISRRIFRKYSNTSANNDALLLTYKS